MLVIVLLLVAAVLFGVAAFNVAARFNLMAAGLFFFVLAFLLPLLLGAVG
jgi:hypothetical protein